jgi:hypothetical protein
VALTSTLNGDGIGVITSQHCYTVPSSTMTTLGDEDARLVSPTPQRNDESDSSPPLTTYYHNSTDNSIHYTPSQAQ